MLSSEVQEKVLKELLKRKTNTSCADCSAISPTWASLDFGVFVCSNCSGPHRSLGPTVTRIKSTKLDRWNQDWISCMQVGNTQINQFWEGGIAMNSSFSRKPSSVASHQELKKFVIDKYVRKMFVPKGEEKSDPKTFYKNCNSKSEQPQNESTEKKVEAICLPDRPKTITTIAVIQKTDLLFFQQKPSPELIRAPSIIHQQDEEFGSYTDSVSGSVTSSVTTANTITNNIENRSYQSHANTSQTKDNSASSLSFDQMMKTNNQLLEEQRKRHQMQLQMNLNMNMQYNPQQSSYQFGHHHNQQNTTELPIQNPLHNHNYFQPNLHKTHSLGAPIHQIETNNNQNVECQGIVGNLNKIGANLHQNDEESWSGWH